MKDKLDTPEKIARKNAEEGAVCPYFPLYITNTDCYYLGGDGGGPMLYDEYHRRYKLEIDLILKERTIALRSKKIENLMNAC